MSKIPLLLTSAILAVSVCSANAGDREKGLRMASAFFYGQRYCDFSYDEREVAFSNFMIATVMTEGLTPDDLHWIIGKAIASAQITEAAGKVFFNDASWTCRELQQASGLRPR